MPTPPVHHHAVAPLQPHHHQRLVLVEGKAPRVQSARWVQRLEPQGVEGERRQAVRGDGGVVVERGGLRVPELVGREVAVRDEEVVAWREGDLGRAVEGGEGVLTALVAEGEKVVGEWGEGEADCGAVGVSVDVVAC